MTEGILTCGVAERNGCKRLSSMKRGPEASSAVLHGYLRRPKKAEEGGTGIGAYVAWG